VDLNPHYTGADSARGIEQQLVRICRVALRQFDDRQIGAFARLQSSGFVQKPQGQRAVPRAHFQKQGRIDFWSQAAQKEQLVPETEVGVRGAAVGPERDVTAAREQAPPGMRLVTEIGVRPGAVDDRYVRIAGEKLDVVVREV